MSGHAAQLQDVLTRKAETKFLWLHHDSTGFQAENRTP